MLLTALMCMSMAIYHEARGESEFGQYAVAHVIWNRADHNKENVCEVVTEPKQFSFTNGQTFIYKGERHFKRSLLPKDDAAWHQAIRVALKVITDKSRDNTHGATFYHADYVHPAWADNMRVVLVNGRHIFYKSQVRNL